MDFPFSPVYDDSHPTYATMAPSHVDDGVAGNIMLVLCVFAIILFLTFLILLYARFVHHQPEENRSAIGALALRLALALSEALALEPEPEPELPNVGLDPSVIVALPLYVYCVREAEAGQGHENEPAIDCLICLNVFNAGDRVRILPNCRHSFHAECIDKWLGLNATCPVCRAHIALMLQLKLHDPPVRFLGPFEVVMTTTASSLCCGGTSDHAPPSRTTQSGGREHCTSLRVMV